MKIILVGYPGSQKIVPASKYLTKKYLPNFDVTYLNYEGKIEGWSRFVFDYLKDLPDKHVILGLDDYLLNALPLKDLPIIDRYTSCIKLCPCTEEEQEEYPVTTQYTLWDKAILLFLLDDTSTPWDFEVTGSKIFRSLKLKSKVIPILSYNVHSALSKRWDGINLEGLNEEDTLKVKELL